MSAEHLTTRQTGQPPSFDVVIVGGGITGAALACALAGQPWRCALLDAGSPPQAPPASAPPLRVSALTPVSQRILQALQVWPALAPAPQPFERMRVWDAGGFGEIVFDAAESGVPCLGWIAANDSLRHAFWRRLERQPAVELYSDVRLQAIDGLPAASASASASAGEPRADGPPSDGPRAQRIDPEPTPADALTVTLADGRRLRARLLVAADGGASQVRELAGIRVWQRDYRQRGIVATVRPQHHHQATAWQRFLPTGPVALLPLAGGLCSVVWSIAGGRAERLLALSDEAFARELGAATAHRLGTLSPLGPRAGFPLRALAAHDYVGHRLALIGDAAHVVHPLAGQGVNLGLLDAAALAEILDAAACARRDPGAAAGLRRYQRWRKGDNLLTLGTLDGFERLFGNSLAPLRLARNLGLNAADALPPLKRWLARQAAGAAGAELPALARVTATR